MILAAYLSWSVKLLVTNVTEPMKWREREGERERTTSWLHFPCCIALAHRSPSMAGFAIQSLLAVSLCQLASTGGYVCKWYQPRNLRKNLCTRDCGDYYCFLTSSSSCSYRPTVPLWKRAQSDNIRRKAGCLTALVKIPPGLRACLNWLAFRVKYLR